MTDRIITQAQNTLMNARIDHIKWSLKQYGYRRREESEILRIAVLLEVSDKIEGWMSSAHEWEFSRVWSRQQDKFARLIKARKVAGTPRTPPSLTYRWMNRKIGRRNGS